MLVTRQPLKGFSDRVCRMPPDPATAHVQPDTSARELQMQYAGGMIRHLGLQMYGGAVPAIAELIANSWDADATRVDVNIPLDKPITSELCVEVLDDGIGMSFEELNESYLVVGLDRRRGGRGRSPIGRQVMGRKGIGKLAGFGIAKTMRIETKKHGHLTVFEMNFGEMTSADQFVEPYKPTVIYDGPDHESTIPYDTGTRVVLKDLEIRNAINSARFRLSMSRRFSILNDQFAVAINDVELTRDEILVQFRFPSEDLTREHIPGFGTVRWWFGFTEKPIPHEEARGIIVMVRGKLAQTPFFFDQTGGTQGQLGLQYMTGEVHADDIDNAEDLIATDRASIRWEHERARLLLDWGQNKVRSCLQQWSRLRRERNEERIAGRLRNRLPQLERIRQFPDTHQRELFAAVNSLARVETIDEERLKEIVDFLLRAYENDHLLDLIQQINHADANSLEQLGQVIGEWDVLEAVAVAQLVRGRIAVIDKFRELIDQEARELPDMQDFIENHPWVLRPEWAPLERERSIEKILRKHILGKNADTKIPKKKGRRRVDAICLASPGMIVVVELKRPGRLAGRKELRQLEDYVDSLREWQGGTSNPAERSQVVGFLIYGRLREDSGELVARMARDGNYVEPWDKLWSDAERLHRDYFRVMRSRARADDSRIIALEQLDEECDEEAAE